MLPLIVGTGQNLRKKSHRIGRMVDSDLGNEWEGERNFKEFFFWGGGDHRGQSEVANRFYRGTKEY